MVVTGMYKPSRILTTRKFRRNLASAKQGKTLAVNILSRDLLKDDYE